MDKRIAAIVAVVVTVAWAVSFTVDMFRPSYEPPPVVHTLMLMVVGAALGIPLIKKNGDKE